jgi:methionyl aminopeptidase
VLTSLIHEVVRDTLWCMSIETAEELEALRAAGRVVADAIRAMRLNTRPGVSTGELDDIGARVFAKAGARSGPQLDYGFPGTSRISVNDEAVHGIPVHVSFVTVIWSNLM